MKRPRGRPVRWTPDLIKAAHDLARQFGPKRAAPMFGVTYNTFVHALHRHGASIKQGRPA